MADPRCPWPCPCMRPCHMAWPVARDAVISVGLLGFTHWPGLETAVIYAHRFYETGNPAHVKLLVDAPLGNQG